MKVILIAAMTPSGVIGRTSKPCGGIAHTPSADIYGGGATACLLCGGEGDSRAGVPPGRIPCNDLPWGRAYPEDLARFKAATMGHAVVAGRRTAESMGKAWPLKGRTCLQVTSRKQVYPLNEGGIFVPDLETAVDSVREVAHHDTLFIIGGARLFAEALPIADELDLALIGREYAGDVLFPMHRASFDEPVVAAGYQRGHNGPRVMFECISREPCPTNADITFTRWMRR